MNVMKLSMLNILFVLNGARTPESVIETIESVRRIIAERIMVIHLLKISILPTASKYLIVP